MSAATAQPTGVDRSDEPLSMFYLRAENEDGQGLDLAVVAETAAVDLPGQHYFGDTEPVAEQSTASRRGVMTLANHPQRSRHCSPDRSAGPPLTQSAPGRSERGRY